MVPAPRVLVVDDDPEFLKLMEERLTENHRFDVFAAGSAADAMAALDEREIDCVVTDSLVLDSGEPLVHAVRTRDSEIPLIYYTGKRWNEIAASAVSADVSDYVRKGTGSLTEVAHRLDVLVGTGARATLDSAGAASEARDEKSTPSALDVPGDEWDVIGVFDPRAETDLTVEIAEAVADYLDRDVDSFSIYESVDADALETLVLPRSDGVERRGVNVRFPVAGHLVAVTSAGEMTIRSRLGDD